MLTIFSSFVGCHLHELGHIQITITKYPLGIFLLFRNTAPSKNAGNQFYMFHDIPQDKISQQSHKIHIQVIPYRMRGLHHASSSEVTCHQMIQRTKE